jgi:alpha-D-ribose 1-methylphosphonate 5-triphosphate diphosphatase
MSKAILSNARVVLAGEVISGTVQMRGGLIAAINQGTSLAAGREDLEGDYLAPGFVELHTDNLERHLMPRPKVRWPELPAMMSHDAEVASAGITTVYDALGVGDSDPEAMRGQDMEPVVAALREAHKSGLLRAEHRLHIRCELPAPNTLSLFESFVDDPLVGLVSLMDHTPGQRQWEDVEQARIYFTGKKGWSREKFERCVFESVELQERYAVPHRRYLTDYARQRGIALASHDDTKPEHVEQAYGEGVTICEFPTRVEAARAARVRGMSTVMGAPNVVRGGSHSGNVAALELARLGLLDTLSSDYVPASLLIGAFRLVDSASFTVPAAIATISRNPARSLGLDDRGEIRQGLRADLVQIRVRNRQPIVRAVWRGGKRVF